jgi:hypothetical protein
LPTLVRAEWPSFSSVCEWCRESPQVSHIFGAAPAAEYSLAAALSATTNYSSAPCETIHGGGLGVSLLQSAYTITSHLLPSLSSGTMSPLSFSPGRGEDTPTSSAINAEVNIPRTLHKVSGTSSLKNDLLTVAGNIRFAVIHSRTARRRWLSGFAFRSDCKAYKRRAGSRLCSSPISNRSSRLLYRGHSLRGLSVVKQHP